MIVRTAQGEGQGECILCKKRGRYVRQWMRFLYEVQGRDGVYCAQCIKELTIYERIRIEIGRQEKWLQEAGYTPYNVDMAFYAIKRLLKESEVGIKDVVE